MAIGISEAHTELAGVARSFLENAKVREAARALFDSPDEPMPEFWRSAADLGWLGLHVPEEYGGSGYGLAELLVVTEEIGRSLAPGPFVPTVALSALLADRGSVDQARRWLGGLAEGTITGSVSLRNSVTLTGGTLSGDAVVLGAGLADLVGVCVGDDFVIVEAAACGVTPATSMDPTRRSARVSLEGVTGFEVVPGAASHAASLARALFSAEAVGAAQLCVDMATGYAKQRKQFGRVIATFQAVKHHLADMLVAAETAIAAVWDSGRAHAGGDPEQFRLAAAIAAARSVPAVVRNAELNIQIHGGIGFTWDHDGHVILRRATAIAAVTEAACAQDDVAQLAVDGVSRNHGFDLPPEAEQYRELTVRAARELASIEDEGERRTRMIETGYVQPHWPEPWGRAAPALEQLVIEEEFQRAGLGRVDYGITGWVILTIIQHGSDDQVNRWVRPTLEREIVWCQLFSEPDAGSDAAGIRTRGERVEGGWLVTGQKVWTSGAQDSKLGLATVRTDPSKPKHAGITMMVVDMEADGVEVRPLREATGNAIFNEVFFEKVFVPDDDVVGGVDDGWTVARATLGNERVSIGGSSGTGPVLDIVDIYRRHGDGDRAMFRELGDLFSERQSIQAVNLRRVERAVTGAGPGPEGNVTKLLAAEHAQRSADFARRVIGAGAQEMEGDAFMIDLSVLFVRALTIAGGTSEITRNQIGERILGLPRDPLVK